MTRVMYEVIQDVIDERFRQDEKWGQQNHPDGTGGIMLRHEAIHRRAVCEWRHAEGVGSWSDILLEEVYEALAEDDPAKLREELVQAAAVIVAWIECIDRRGA